MTSKTAQFHFLLWVMITISFAGWTAPVTFNDSALLNAVKSQWEAATGLTLSDPPEDSELANPLFTTLEALQLGIIDLTGLEACTALTEINLGMNQISDLAPLSTLTGLLSLDLGSGTNPLTSQSNFDFYLTGANLITTLAPLAGLVNLEYLSIIGDDGITSLEPIRTLDSLATLWLCSNPISDFSPLTDTADTLSLLGIFNCGLENSDIAIFNNLINLDGIGFIAEPALTDISALTDIHPTLVFSLVMTGVSDVSVVSNYTGLQQCMLMGNPIAALPDMSGFINLQFLMASQNQLNEISGLNGLASLQQLQLNNNGISDISALETCTGLKNIDLQNNQLTDIQPLIDNTGIGALQSLNIKDNPFFDGTPFCDENQLDQLQALAPSAQINQNTSCGVPVTLTIIITGTGETDPAAGTYTYSQGQTFYIHANPVNGSGWAFDHWAGDASGTNEDMEITMDGDKTVEAVFVTPGDYTLTVQRTGAGAGGTSPDPGTYAYLQNRSTWVNAHLADGSYFGGWQGNISGYLPDQQVIMDSDKTVIAAFATDGYTLTLNTSGEGWIRHFNTGVIGFIPGAQFTLEANADQGWTFDHWEGDTGSGNSENSILDVTMDQNRSITAVFSSVPQALLTMNVGGTGAGTTNPAPGVHSFNQGTYVWVQAIPGAGSAFDHWEGNIGGANPYQDSISVLMDQARNLTAIFVPAAWTLTVQKTGNGLTDPVPGSYGYVNGAQEYLYANLASGGDAFYRWTGDLMPGANGENSYQYLTMNQNRTVTAEFVPGNWTLAFSTEGSYGYCLPYPEPGIYAYLDGRMAYLNINYCSGIYFAGWSGDAGGYQPNISVEMDGNKSITAHYATSGFTLTTLITGNGWLNINPGTCGFADGVTLALEAHPNYGYVFDHWEGDVPAGEDPNNAELPVLMDMNRSLTAVFAPDYKILTIIIDGLGSTEPSGSATPGTQHIYSTNQFTCIQAILGPSTAFDHWSGDIGDADSHNVNICVQMDQDRTITAHFLEADWNLNLQVSGNGMTSPEPGAYGYLDGTWANFSAILVSGGDAFDHWSGDIDTSAPENLGLRQLMDRNRTVTANFVPGDWTLTLNKTGDPDGYIYPTPGTYAYLNGQIASINAYTSSSAYFAGWTGDITSDLPYLEIPMDSNIDAEANFAETGYVLTTNVEGEGYLNISSLLYFANGMEPVLKAYSQSGWTFDYWSGDLPAGADINNAELTVLMNQDRTLTAHFKEEARMLTIIIEGEGVTNPAGSPYPGITYAYPKNAYVFVGAELGAGDWAFSHWTGDTGSGDPTKWFLELVMNQDRTVVAHFVPADWHLTVGYTGNGSIFPPPGTYAFANGAVTEVVANVVDGGDAFYEWIGDTPEGMDPHQFDLHITMDQDRTLNAVFSSGDFALTIQPIEGGGTAQILPSPGIYSYFAGQTAWMEARVTELGMYWGGWSGDVNTYDKIHHFVMDGNKTVTPHVTTSGYILTLTTGGAEGATSPEGSTAYSAGAMPTIHALETGSGLFDQWSGDLPAGMDPYDMDPVILMDQDRTITANFVEADWYLYIQALGNGTTDPVPDLYWFLDGDEFSISAYPGTDAQFLRWQGDLPEGQDPNATTLSG
ncbi:MAG TPA: hypothetical protein PLI09_28735, partial [Candidatus Hydrogenedentes bacterium]|nr:hypothetical protein [Candidatus Hydrogenedentota bacterium]